MPPLLTVNKLSMDFGGIRAIDKCSLRIKQGEIVALIGPNGAGKTTFFNCLTGIYQPTAGELLWTPPNSPSRTLNGLKPHHITEQGLARTFQNIRVFRSMTVLENVMIGRHCRTTATILGAILRPPSVAREEQKTIATSFALLERVGLADVAHERADNLPYGAQRRLEIARALATDPLLLLLDEPAAGMNPQEGQELETLIRSINNDRTAVLLIEHDMQLVMRLADHIFVLEYGRLIAEGPPEAIRNDPAVIRAYLGEEEDHYA
ncbi:ABC transporter ATP-binding protein [Desulfobulbus oligotrophicus]|jgi:branched-chain amino acid transport system ATP-binding protein|uniref:ABC transporter ATP-binding protein n=1 Tax=Desulfobulbus oligotrophicus TaxID=1909699 RepID=A0A7T5VFL9_9BACT|nr:ABC transporter ATP-binding protein [Desulfobulbus oligotrophicus]